VLNLKNWDIKINRGILTGLNEAFIINGVSKDKLIESDIKNAELIRPILRGQDIKAWQPSFSDLWLITTLPSMKVDIDDYPDIKEYLLSFGKEKLEQSGNKGSRKKTNNKWFETQDSISYYKDFFKPKLIYPNMTKFLPFVYDEKGYFTNQKCFIITSEQTCLKYLTAFLNSKIFRFCFKDNFPELLGNTFELSKVFFEQIPIKQLNEKEQQPFIKLVDQIIELKQQGKDTTTIEAKIDELVYKLYDLTAEEIKIVEEP
jgi:adenine-specific DNA-methyltransferase